MDKLSREVATALAAGMSYGKWKALQTQSKPEKSEEIPEGWKVCGWCGRPFKPKRRGRQIYCEFVCQRRAQERRLTEQRNAQKRGMTGNA